MLLGLQSVCVILCRAVDQAETPFRQNRLEIEKADAYDKVHLFDTFFWTTLQETQSKIKK